MGDLHTDSLSTARKALRAAVGHSDAEEGPVRAAVHVEPLPRPPRLGHGSAVAAVLAAAARLAVLGEWGRVNICPADDFRKAGYDQSRDRSRIKWSMRVAATGRRHTRGISALVRLSELPT